MRSEIGKEVRKQFERVFLQNFPMFVRDKTTPLPPGWRLYASSIASDLTFYVMLVLMPRSDGFTADVIWSRCNELPPHIPNSYPTDQPNGDVQLIRLSNFWCDNRTPGQIWNVDKPWSTSSEFGIPTFADPTQEEIANVAPLIEDAVAKLRQFAGPYFAKIASHFGYEFPTSSSGRKGPATLKRPVG